MAETPRRPRIMFDCPEEIRLAVRLCAARKMTDHASVIVNALREYMPTEIEEARKILSTEPAPPPSRRGRKPKPKGD